MNNKQTFLKDTKHYFIGAFSLIDEDLPDGAFYQVHIDNAAYHLKSCTECLKDLKSMASVEMPKDLDEHDIVEYYFKNKGEK